MRSLDESDFIKTCDWCEGYGELSDCCHTPYHEASNGTPICDDCRKFTSTIQCYECENGEVLDEDAYLKAKLENFVNDND